MSVNFFSFISDSPKALLYASVVTILSTYYIVLKCRRDPRLVKIAQTIPGPKGFPLIGNSLVFLSSGVDGCGKIFSDYAKKYGSVYKMWLGNELVIGLSDIEHVEVVFRSTKAMEKPRVLFSGFHDFWGDSVFATTMSVWRRTRKRLQPVFGKILLKFRIDSFNKFVDKHTGLLRSRLNGPEFNLEDYILDLVTDSFLDSYFGVGLTKEEKEYYKFAEILNYSAVYGLSIILYPWCRMKLFISIFFRNKVDTAKARLREFFDKLQQDKSDWEEKSVAKSGSKLLTKAFAPIAHKLEEEIQKKDYMFHEVMDLIAASTHTTSTAISYCLLIIAIRKDIQDKLYDEIKEVIGISNGPIGLDDLSELTYLDQVLKETLRLFSSLPNILRGVEEDLKIGSMTIPAGSTVLVNIHEIHLNPISYPNPTEFNPENFTPEAISRRSKYSYVPFSMGPRGCIGKTFAQTIAKLTIATFLRNFKLNTTTKYEEIDRDGGFLIHKPGGYKISITPRQ